VTARVDRRWIIELLCVATLLCGCTATQAPAGLSSAATAASQFGEIAAVLRSPRCINCHPNGNSPRQGDERRVHDYRVTRGPDNRGAPGMRCSACHQEENQNASGVPGAPHWQLAPVSMAWEELSDAQLCHVITDPQSNGGRSTEQLVHHMSEDSLVRWAFNPGAKRAPPPVSQDQFQELVRRWASSGAPCPRAH
jgi:hypothetical protein